jgi:hypothetical protein
VKASVASDIANGGSPINESIESRYGVNPGIGGSNMTYAPLCGRDDHIRDHCQAVLGGSARSLIGFLRMDMSAPSHCKSSMTADRATR